MGLLRVVRLGPVPREFGLIFKAQMVQIGGSVKALWYCESNTGIVRAILVFVKSILLPNDL